MQTHTTRAVSPSAHLDHNADRSSSAVVPAPLVPPPAPGARKAFVSSTDTALAEAAQKTLTGAPTAHGSTLILTPTRAIPAPATATRMSTTPSTPIVSALHDPSQPAMRSIHVLSRSATAPSLGVATAPPVGFTAPVVAPVRALPPSVTSATYDPSTTAMRSVAGHVLPSHATPKPGTGVQPSPAVTLPAVLVQPPAYTPTQPSYVHAATRVVTAEPRVVLTTATAPSFHPATPTVTAMPLPPSVTSATYDPSTAPMRSVGGHVLPSHATPKPITGVQPSPAVAIPTVIAMAPARTIAQPTFVSRSDQAVAKAATHPSMGPSVSGLPRATATGVHNILRSPSPAPSLVHHVMPTHAPVVHHVTIPTPTVYMAPVRVEAGWRRFFTFVFWTALVIGIFAILASALRRH